MSSNHVMFRGRRACTCLAAWLPVYEAELLRRGLIKHNIDIYQLIGNAAASASTHSNGGAADLAQYTWACLQVARQMGADADWHRGPPSFMDHAHLVLRGCPHNGPARYQITAVDDDYNGLGYMGRGGRDNGPRPLSKRTWKQGIAWANRSQPPAKEDDMPTFYKKMYKTKQKLRAGKWDYVQLGKGNVTFLFGSEATVFAGKVCFRVTGLEDDDRIYVQSVRSTKRGKVTTSVTSLGTDNFGGEYFQYPIAGTLAASSNSRLRMKIKAPRKGCRIEYVWPMIPNWK